MGRHVRAVALAIAPNTLARAFNGFMRVTQQRSLDGPYISPGELPVERTQSAQIEQRVSGDGAGEIDVRIEVAHGERSRRPEQRLAAMQARVARSSNRSPAAALAIHKDDMVE